MNPCVLLSHALSLSTFTQHSALWPSLEPCVGLQSSPSTGDRPTPSSPVVLRRRHRQPSPSYWPGATMTSRQILLSANLF